MARVMLCRSGASLLVCLAACLPAAAQAAPSATRPALAYDHLSDLDLAFLVQAARRAAMAAWTERPIPSANYRPRSLRNLVGRVHVSLRRFGAVIGQGESGEANLIDAAVTAAEAAVRSVSSALQKRSVPAAHLGIEVELIGPDEFVKPGLAADLQYQPELFACFEPGVHGVGVELNGRKGRARPSVILAAGYPPMLALQHAESDAGFTAATKQKFAGSIHYFRFRTVHLWQRDAAAEPIHLRRGGVPILAAEITAERLDRAIAAALAHVLRRQRSDTWFHFDYLPSADRYTDVNSLYGQFETAWGIGRFGETVHSARCRDAASHLIAAAQSFVQPIAANVPALAVISTKEVAPLATTGLYLACRARFDTSEMKVSAVKIADAIRMIQKDDGRFDATFPPDPPTEQDVAAAGVAMLGLLQFVQDRPNGVVDRSIRNAETFYRSFFDHTADRDGAAWLAPALAASYRRRPDPPVSDFLLAVGDWLAAHQIRPQWRVAPELIGAIVDDNSTTPDARTARCLVALCDSLWMARRLGDHPREARLENAVRLAARFVMQLQFRREECYFTPAPDATIGGVRASLWNNDLRINDSAMAVWGLTRAREELIGAPPALDDNALSAAASQP